MVATDTVVGIVGAVLLVAVMAGVFVYEYNNPVAEADPSSEDGMRAAFASRYEGMSADDDIDGDGAPNYRDDDLDGDGTPNGNDTEVATSTEGTGVLGPQAGPVTTEFILGVTVGNGSVHVVATVSLSTAVPLYPGNFVVQLIDPDGTVVDDAASAPTGSATLSVETGEDDELKPGEWTVRVTNNQAGPGGTAQARAEVHYPAPSGDAAHHPPEK